MRRVFGFIAALCLAPQAFALGGDAWVCRYTGEAMDGCACPHDRDAQPASPQLSEGTCCELRHADVPREPAVLRHAATAPSRSSVVQWALPAAGLDVFVARSRVWAGGQPQAPPKTPVYLSIRTLLI